MVERRLMKVVTLVMYTSVVTVSDTRFLLVLLLLESDILSLIFASTWSVASSLSPRVLRLSRIELESCEQVETKATALSCAFLQAVKAEVQLDFDALIVLR